MGKSEHPLVWYYDQKTHFADLMNGWLFHGQCHLTSDDISDADRRILRRNRHHRYQDRYRDLYKCMDHMAFRLLIGVEEQGHVHYTMPLRVMDYDCASYSVQKSRISNRHRTAKDLENDEFLSGFSKEDRLLPTITLVLYCGLRPWDGALRLHDLLDLDRIPSELKHYIADYPIHVLDICHTPDHRLEEFPSEIRTMFLFFKYRDNPDQLMRKLAGADTVSQDTYDVITDFAGEERLKCLRPKEEGEKIHMCKAIDILIAEGEKRGAAREKENTERERQRAEKAEARVRELERMLKD